MTHKELRHWMKVCRCIYKGITNPLEAYKKNFTIINRNVEYGKYSRYLLRYNANIYESKTGIKM